MYDQAAVAELGRLHSGVEPVIKKRLAEFSEIGEKATDEQLFVELAFCLLTPQSKALYCWSAVQCLVDSELLLKGDEYEIAREIRTKARFHNQKAKSIVLARRLFSEEVTGPEEEQDEEMDRGRPSVRHDDKSAPYLNVRRRLTSFESVYELRDWLVMNVRGMGYKEASHFLRNIGKGHDLAILDRHILGNLVTLGVIPAVPASISPREYKRIEAEMQRFCSFIGMRMDHLDLVLWYKQTGEVFK